ncbi:hypothetical protein G5C60_32085 [Streptomyces sp. HC44]|uniref:Integrase n=1 Tax=Streptomyces scabichelini TaxID=2711217 RepID=A0A6G4VDS3_9ACTN|nr:hypothetical protein [Streptomyces scabichelini]NGO12121.1 hypothetical protein [Streptomyces scabichelini]
MTPQPAFQPVASARFRDDEPVFGPGYRLVEGIRVPLFGDVEHWSGDCTGRPANQAPTRYRIHFAPEDPLITLQLKETAFAQFNPTHRILRQAAIYRSAEPVAFPTVKMCSQKLRVILRWGRKQGLPADPGRWAAADWQSFMDELATTVSDTTVANHLGAVRTLRELAGVITGVTPFDDPWDGRSAAEIGRQAVLNAAADDGTLATPAIPPQTWWPLIRAAWTYVHTFAPDILRWKDHFERLAADLGKGAEPCRKITRTTEEVDAQIASWLADPDNHIPVRAVDDGVGKAGSVIWSTLARIIWGVSNGDRFTSKAASGRARRRLVEEAAGQGRTMVMAGNRYWSLPIACTDAAQTLREDGSTRPWRTHITQTQLDVELRMLRAACYVFVTAMSLMRDSEVQEIQREAVTTYYGSPAIKSQKIKHDPKRPESCWWIIEPVAEAIAVAEQLSWHPTHLFASLKPPRGKKNRGGRGITASDDIDYFVERVNTNADAYGLEPIPDAHVRSHMFRRTMSVITGREPDSEVALGLQLKHAARRAMANCTTQAYAQMDTRWAKEFDQQLEHAAALRLVDLLKARRTGEKVAVGPGAERLHAGLDQVISAMDDNLVLRAQIADERAEAALLADQFPNLHLGTINHCMFDAPQAECQNELPADQRGRAPLIGACQPDRCRNSVITRAHAPIWIAEEDDLKARAKDPNLSPPGRETVLIRLTDVQRITRALQHEGVTA